MAIDVTDNPQRHRYDLTVDGVAAGHVAYRADPGIIDLIHTEVYDEFEGRGLGGKLASAVLDDVRARGLKLVPSCPFIASYIDSHPEYQDLVLKIT
jgi:predicted GNAT family acetyltransferase